MLFVRMCAIPRDTSLPDYQTCFPKWKAKKLEEVIGTEHPIEAIRLLERVGVYFFKLKTLRHLFLEF